MTYKKNDIAGRTLLGTDKIREPVIELRFSSDNNTIIALGDSGSIYQIETNNLKDLNTPSERERWWNDLEENVRAIHNKAFEMGLTRINPSQFESTRIDY